MDFKKLRPPFTRNFIKTDFSKYVREDSIIDWNVDKNEFNESRRFSKICLWSSKFPKDNNANFKWQLCFYPFGNEDETNYSSVFLHLEWRRVKIPILTAVHFSIKLNDHTGIEEKYMQHKFEENSGWGYPQFIENSILKLLKIETNLIISAKVSAQYEISNFRFEQNLLDNYSNLLEEGAFSDMILYVEQDKTEFKVHRNILACRSKVFASMLSHEMLEKISNRIVIKDFSSSVVKNLLNFLYCCKTEFEDINETLDLLEISDKYDITDLKNQCTEHLVGNLDKDNALDILLKSTMYDSHDLKDTVLKYMQENKTSFSNPTKYEILKDYPELIIEIATLFADNKK